MIRRGPWLGIFLVCIRASAWADAPDSDDETPDVPEPGATVERFDGARRVDAVFHGPLLGYALPRGSSGRRDVVFLTRTTRPAIPDRDDADDERGPCDGESREATGLYQLRYEDAASPPALALLRDDLPADATGLDAMDLDGDGVDELLLYRDGELQVLRELAGSIGGSGPEPLLSDPDMRIRPPESGLVRHGAELEDAWLQLPGIGAVRYFRPDPQSSTLRLAAQAELPVHASYSADALGVYSHAPQFLGRSAAGGATFAIAAEPFGNERLRVMLLRPERAPRESPVEECWARFPGSERIVRQFPRLLDGKPVLLVTTMPADKLSLFDEQFLRIFPLKRDRSRTGRPPRVAFKTRINNINQAVPFLIDLDGDGRQDLVLGYWKGFDGERVVLDVHLQKEDGAFPASPKTTGMDVEGADGSVLLFGDDFDGDDRPDLLLFAEENLLVYRGSATQAKGKNVVESEPAFRVPLGYTVGGAERVLALGSAGVQPFVTGGGQRPRAVDLDGDGRSELLLVRGRGQASLVLFER